MAMITCRECGQPVSSEAAACPECGVSPQKQSTNWLWVPVGLVAAFVLFLVFGSFARLSPPDPELEEQSRKRLAIELCWKEQARKSLTPGEARFIAGACETMEREFEDKYRVKP